MELKIEINRWQVTGDSKYESGALFKSRIVIDYSETYDTRRKC